MNGEKSPGSLVLQGKAAESFCEVMNMLRCGYDVVLSSDLRTNPMNIKVKMQKPVRKIQLSSSWDK